MSNQPDGIRPEGVKLNGMKPEGVKPELSEAERLRRIDELLAARMHPTQPLHPLQRRGQAWVMIALVLFVIQLILSFLVRGLSIHDLFESWPKFGMILGFGAAGSVLATCGGRLPRLVVIALAVFAGILGLGAVLLLALVLR